MNRLIALLALASAAGAQTEQTGTTAATFLKLGTGSRSVAMGEAYTALSDDADGISYNPAGLATARTGVLLTHNEWFKEVRSEHLSALANMGGLGTLGVNLNYLSIPSQDITVRTATTSDPSQNFKTIGSLSPFDLYGTVSYGFGLSKSLNMGLSLKAIGHQIDDKLGVGIGVDLGLTSKTSIQGLTFGVAAQNLGLPVTLVQDKFDPPMLLRFGGSYQTASKNMIISVDANLPNDNQTVFALGLEYNVANTLYPRFGYRVDGIFNPWSAGLGFKMDKYRIDLATVPYGELGQTYRASLAFDFGSEVSETTAPKASIPQVTALVAPQAILEPPRNAMLLTDTGTYVSIKPNISYPDQVKSWTLFIYAQGEKPAVMKKTAGSGPLPQELTWNGNIDDSERASAGVYPAVLAVKYVTGQVVYSNFIKLTLSNVSQMDFKPQ